MDVNGWRCFFRPVGEGLIGNWKLLDSVGSVRIKRFSYEEV